MRAKMNATPPTHLQIKEFRITARIPEVKNVNGLRPFIDRVNNPVLCPPPDTEKIGAVRRSREREVPPCQRRFAKVDAEDAVEAFDLLEGELFAVVAEIDGKLF